MRIISLVFAGCLLLIGAFACQKDFTHLGIENNAADDFERGPGYDDPTRIFLPSTGDSTDPWAEAMSTQSARVSLDHRHSPWPLGLAAFDQVLQSILKANQPIDNKRFALESLSFTVLDMLKRRTPLGPQRSEAAARYLTHLMTYSEPIDLHLLANYFQLAENALQTDQAKAYRNYIEHSAQKILKGKYSNDRISRNKELMEWQARFALETLNAKR